MGDLQDWLHDPNGGVSGGRSSSLPSSSPPAPAVLPTNLVEIGSEYMQKAEEETRGIIAQVQPTVVSEERRQAVIEYVQGLIKNAVGCEVFPFGSVPLKTYLPDGDIDLTAFGGVNIDEALANDVCLALEKAEQRKTSKFVVKDVQLIRAEVKLVKCLVQNIVVDISFNQFGGLCTLCFLEQVDRVIGKDHLFKRSIILIKAWCYYESRILGAHHGLISTYALETLVLYIFHLFHSSLNGPLAVLYKFLDYFSKFDWDNYCISLNGPVRISSLPELTAESPENGGHDLFLNDDFLKCCVEMFSAPWRGYETGARTFPPKHLNIVDPLKENNNLGRSVSKGNFYRIKSAFTYGARKLGRILSQPEKSIGEEIQKFFSNTLDRHGKGQRPDVQDLQQISGLDSFAAASFVSGTELQESQAMYAMEYGHSSGMPEDWKMVYDKQLYTGVSNIEIPGTEIISDKILNEPSKSMVSSLSKLDSSLQATAVSDNRLKGDAKDLATSRIQNLTISNDSPKSSMPHLSKAQCAPHLYFPNSLTENGEANGDKHTKRAESDGSTGNSIGDQDENQLVSNHKVVSPGGSKHNLSSIALISEDFYPSNSYYQLSSTMAGNPEPLNSLSDLSGDYECHVLSLNYGWMWYNYFMSSSIPSIPASVISHLQSMKSWDVIRRTVQLRQNIIAQINANGVFTRPIYYPMNQTLLPVVAGFALEEMPKPRGTGTYFPNMNHYRDRPSTPRGRNQAPLRSPRTNGRMMPFATENCFPERSNREQQPQAPQALTFKYNGRSGPSDNPSGSPGKKFNPNANGSTHFPHRVADFGSIGHVPPEPPLLRGSWQTNSGLPLVQTLSPNLPSPGTETLKPVLNMDKDRMAQSYRLKDEEDFPPLSI